MRVCYFGAFDPSYARNDFLRRSLEVAGCQLITCNVPPAWPTYRKYPSLLRQFRRIGRTADLIIVAEFGQTIVPLARLLGQVTRIPVVFDHVIGLYEVSVVERRRHDPRSFSARKLFWLDKYAGHLANGILTGTDAYKEYLVAAFGFPHGKVFVAPLGVNDAVFHPLPEPLPPQDKLVVSYWGSFIPNHGVDIILEAAAKLKGRNHLIFRFIGDGEGKAKAVALAAQLRLSNVEFLPRVPFESLPVHIAASHVVLGNFGDTPQAQKAMANKVLQGLAMQKAVITGDTLATRENFANGEHLWLCQPGNAEALASGLHALATDTALRDNLARRGYQRVLERLTPGVVGGQLKAYLAKLLPAD